MSIPPRCMTEDSLYLVFWIVVHYLGVGVSSASIGEDGIRVLKFAEEGDVEDVVNSPIFRKVEGVGNIRDLPGDAEWPGKSRDEFSRNRVRETDILRIKPDEVADVESGVASAAVGGYFLFLLLSLDVLFR